MAIRVQSAGEVVTAYIIGDLDHHSAKEMREEIDASLERMKPKLLILDFKDVTFMDSSGIGLIMGRYRLMQMLGGEIRVSNVSAQLRKVMRLAGLDRLAVIDNGSVAK
ncbi:MAG: STAS domain-containing protein [Oscillospiraceae bacterium]|nr:STAS domain-containing protein [Oscillospiraceae bacterium]